MNKKNVTISNPMLIAAMELVKKDSSKENIKVFIDELLRARFLSPVIITPPPVPDENGVTRLTSENKINVPMAATPDGRSLFMAFTDMEELKKANKEKNINVLSFDFKDYVQMIMNSDEKCRGVLINPYGSNMLVSKEMIQNILGKPVDK